MGAGLLANAVYQYQIHWLTLRIREQARSHILIGCDAQVLGCSNNATNALHPV